MANIELAVTPNIRIFPFSIPGGAVQQYTAIPKARLTFQAADVTIVAKIATNTTSIAATCTLPANYAYTFEYVAAEVQFLTDVDDADNFDNIGDLEFGFGDGLGGRRSGLFSDGLAQMALNAGSVKVWRGVNPYTPPVYNLTGATAAVFIRVNDFDAGATAEGDFSCVLSVLQYELEQVFNFPLNFPLPVSQR